MKRFKDYGLWHTPVAEHQGYVIYKLTDKKNRLHGYTVLHTKKSKSGKDKKEFICSAYTIQGATNHTLRKIFERFKREYKGETQLKTLQ